LTSPWLYCYFTNLLHSIFIVEFYFCNYGSIMIDSIADSARYNYFLFFCAWCMVASILAKMSTLYLADEVAVAKAMAAGETRCRKDRCGWIPENATDFLRCMPPTSGIFNSLSLYTCFYTLVLHNTQIKLYFLSLGLIYDVQVFYNAMNNVGNVLAG